MQASPTTNDNTQQNATGFLSAFIARDRVEVDVLVSSKKRLLEEVADILTVHSSDLDRDTVFEILNERERLGSTGIGHGIAIPHGRIEGIEQPIICAMQLSEGLNFDSIDDIPVSFVVGLLVPADANQTHLKILARLAGAFRDTEIRDRLMTCQDSNELLLALSAIH